MKSKNPFINQLQQKALTDDIALKHNGKAYSYSSLLNESLNVASYLKSIGCKKGDRAVLATETGFELLTIIYATMMLEMTVALIDPHMGRHLYYEKLKQFKPHWAFIDSRLLLLQEHPILRYVYLRLKKESPYIPYSKAYQKIATGKRLPLFQYHYKLTPTLSQKAFKLSEEFIDFNYIITYTSGTIKAPKGVVHSINTIYESIDAVVNILKENNTRSIATHLPHFLLIGICSGITVHLWDEKWSSSKKLSFIENNKIQGLFGPPAEYQSLIKHCSEQKDTFPDCLKLLLLGSAPVHSPFIKKLLKYIHPETAIKCIYGMTEHLVVSIADGREKINYPTDGDLLGDPLSNVKIEIGSDSEILVGSNQLFKQYFKLAEAKKMHPSGDLGIIDKNNKLILIGRKKDMIIRRNFNIYPALYETTIKQIAGIDDAVLIGIYDEELADESVVLVIESSQDLDKQMILNALNRGNHSIDPQAIPDRIIFQKIPRKGRQKKIDRQKLRVEHKPVLV